MVYISSESLSPALPPTLTGISQTDDGDTLTITGDNLPYDLNLNGETNPPATPADAGFLIAYILVFDQFSRPVAYFVCDPSSSTTTTTIFRGLNTFSTAYIAFYTPAVWPPSTPTFGSLEFNQQNIDPSYIGPCGQSNIGVSALWGSQVSSGPYVFATSDDGSIYYRDSQGNWTAASGYANVVPPQTLVGYQWGVANFGHGGSDLAQNGATYTPQQVGDALNTLMAPGYLWDNQAFWVGDGGVWVVITDAFNTGNAYLAELPYSLTSLAQGPLIIGPNTGRGDGAWNIRGMTGTNALCGAVALGGPYEMFPWFATLESQSVSVGSPFPVGYEMGDQCPTSPSSGVCLVWNGASDNICGIWVMDSGGGVTQTYGDTQLIKFQGQGTYGQIGVDPALDGNVWIAGAVPTMFHSTDGGMSWILETVPDATGTNFLGVYIANPANGQVGPLQPTPIVPQPFTASSCFGSVV